MAMKKLKNIIIIIIIIILLLISIVYILNKNQNNVSNENDYIEEPENIQGSYEIDNTIKELDNRADYFIIKEIFDKTLNYINYFDYDLSQSRLEFNSLEEEKQFLNKYKKDGIDILKSIMPKKYMQNFNMTDDSINDSLLKYANKNVKICNIYVSDNSSNIKTYFVYSNVLSTNEEFNLVIILDSNNKTFNIMLENYIKIEGISKEKILGAKVEQDIKSIESNEYNTYEVPNANNEMYAQELLENYKTYLINSPQRAYDLLYLEFRQKKFNNINKFESYISNRISNIEDMELKKYKVNTYNDYTEYICINQYGDYFIFREKNVMDYSVILDTYTVDTSEFISKYNNSDEQVKVGMNIDKVITALNDKDYEYVYNKLDGAFKNNNFNELENFENYIKNNLFDKNEIESGTFSNEGQIYVYKIGIKSLEGNNEEQKNMTIVMKLLEGTDFIMSFDME